MFHESELIDSQLRALAEEQEELEGRHAISARLFYTPIWIANAYCEITQFQPLSILEEMLLKAGLELREAKLEPAEIADLMGVNTRFIERVFGELRGVFGAFDHPYIETSKTGEVFLAQQAIPTSRTQQRAIGYLPFADQWILTSKLKLINIQPPSNQVLSVPFESDSIPGITIDAVRTAHVLAEARIDNPEERLHLTNAIIEGSPLQRWIAWAIIVVHDVALNDLDVMIIPWQNSEMPSEIEKLVQKRLTQALRSEHIFANDLMGISREEYISSEYTQAEPSIKDTQVSPLDPILSKARAAVTKDAQYVRSVDDNEAKLSYGKAVSLRDGEIRPTFLRLMSEAQERIIVFSPWMNQQAVNEEVLQILADRASQNVVTLLGYGIALRPEEEEKKPQPQLLARLEQIRQPNGFPAVITLWIGNNHSKVVLIDRHTHLMGSHNFLSYRGDHDIRGESVALITIPENVQEASSTMEKLFLTAVANLYKQDETKFQHERLAWYITVLTSCRSFKIVRQIVYSACKQQNSLEPYKQLFDYFSSPIIGITEKNRLDLLEEFAKTVTQLTAWGDQRNQVLLHNPLRNLLSMIISAEAQASLVSILQHYSSSIWKQIGI